MSSEKVALQANGLWKRYGEQDVVRDVSFDVSAGEIVGLLGPNGAGKSTTVGMLYGSVIPDRGTVTIDGTDVRIDGRRARESIGVVTQDDNPDPDFDVRGNLRCFFDYHGVRGEAAERGADQLIAQVGLTEHAKKVPDELSGGLRRRLALARALVGTPKILFLDEPTTGLDPDARQDFWRIILEVRDAGTAIILTTHYMDEAERLCDRVLLIQNGTIVRTGQPRELISALVGDAILEVVGLTERELQVISEELKLVVRPYGAGYVVAVNSETIEYAWQRLAALRPSQLTRRPANLEDVFLRVTGVSLDRSGSI